MPPKNLLAISKRKPKPRSTKIAPFTGKLSYIFFFFNIYSLLIRPIVAIA
jgi:hypothetical protein